MREAAATWAHAAWAASLAPAAAAFDAATYDVVGSQTRLLRALVRRHGASAFGRDHRLDRVRGLRDLPHALPLADYDAHRPYVERVAAGEPNVLGCEPVHGLEPTSGSGAEPKLIPSTAGLRAAFGRGIAPWIVDLLRGDPRIATGPAYWSVSPVLQHDARSAGGLPIGFEDDGAYLGAFGRRLQRAVLAVPSEVRRAADVETFRYLTLLHLAARGDLRLISVWNPSFLALLLDALPRHAEALADDLEHGRCRPPGGPERPDLAPPRSGARARALRGVAAAHDPAATTAALWPRLRLLSCWTDAHAATAAGALAARFPHAALQGKGLLATEAFVSLPLRAAPAPVLAVRSHVFEFVEPGGRATRFAHELEAGDEVEVVVTTGVLYRYRLGDVVRIEGHHRRAPTLRFVGRAGHVSDRVGEKLDERHVGAALEAAWRLVGAAPRFALVACDDRAAPPAYQLFVEGLAAHHDDAVTTAVEGHLRGNPHYAYARDLGQLGPLGVVHVVDSAAAFEDALAARGQRRGDVKPTALSAHGDWAARFRLEPRA